MKYTVGIGELKFPSNFKFGIEIEADNVKTKGKNGLYVGKSAEFINDKRWHMATKGEEALVGEGGAALISPILHDTETDWQDVFDICEHIQKFPGPKGNKVMANSKCGLHVHFDAKCLTKSPNIMRNFLRLYAESEELLYKMCNDVDDPIRKGAINRDYKGIHAISAIWRKGMAAPSGKKILKQLEKGTLKVSYKRFGILKNFMNRYKLDERRYKGLNLTNIGSSKKNTIEFRMANGTLDPEIIKQNVFLYASLINTAIEMTKNPEEYEKRVKEFYKTDVSEEEKVKSFLGLIIENPIDREIYYDRWNSVKTASVFRNNDKKGFAPNRFKREQFENIAKRTPSEIVHATCSRIKGFIKREIDEGDLARD